MEGEVFGVAEAVAFADVFEVYYGVLGFWLGHLCTIIRCWGWDWKVDFRLAYVSGGGLVLGGVLWYN